MLWTKGRYLRKQSIDRSGVECQLPGAADMRQLNPNGCRQSCAVANPTCVSGWTWPGPDFPEGRRKLTLLRWVISPRVRFLAPPRTHIDGH
jgi:hypothetical protein